MQIKKCTRNEWFSGCAGCVGALHARLSGANCTCSINGKIISTCLLHTQQAIQPCIKHRYLAFTRGATPPPCNLLFQSSILALLSLLEFTVTLIYSQCDFSQAIVMDNNENKHKNNHLDDNAKLGHWGAHDALILARCTRVAACAALWRGFALQLVHPPWKICHPFFALKTGPSPRLTPSTPTHSPIIV